ncbi:MAG: SpoIIE family protein phosphatase [Candidatus Kapabacteria bacterium]|nr:SpoIIE family protein phosphatase [Candidatus Kapabacteria bacterium]
MKINKQNEVILIIDDSPNNLELAGSILESVGYDVVPVSSGAEALQILAYIRPDLILLDIMMPEMDGIEVCKRIKQIENIKDIPIIFLTALSETEDIIKAFKTGGVDYITKPFFKEEFIARIKNHIDLYHSKKKVTEYMKRIDSELNRAAEYISSLLPKPLRQNNISADYYFKPSIALGGDVLGYHFVDEDNLALYLLDVSGHGVGAALHSVSIINSIRFQNLSGTDFKSPKEVLAGLNKIYQMTKHNNHFFTLWYGCLNLNNYELKYSSAGHPPAILINKNNVSNFLSVDNFIIGGINDYCYEDKTLQLFPGDSLYIFSDGAFEIKNEISGYRDIEDLRHFLITNRDDNASELSLLYNYQISYINDKILPDDFSILKINIYD